MKQFTNFSKNRSALMKEHNIFRYKDIYNLFKSCKNLVIRGSGTSYNDLALNSDGNTIITTKLDKILNFDKKKKILRCQSGIVIKDILKVILHHKLFIFTTPGTYRATLGGLVATDAHGKNFKKSFFSDSIISLKILTTNNIVIECSHKLNQKLFLSTIGGFGLTGVILEVEIKLLSIPSLLIEKKTAKFKSFDEMFLLMNNFKKQYNYIYTIHNTNNCKLNQGYVIGGKFIESGNTNFKFNRLLNFKFFILPIINRITIFIFNLILHNLRSKKEYIENINLIDFFYPLEKIKNWENLYGKKGFYEYQVFIPKNEFKNFLKTINNEINFFKSFSFLSSTKFISKSKGFFSCNKENSYNFAIDLIDNKHLENNYKKLIKIAKKYNCSINLHKDLFLKKSNFSLSLNKQIKILKQNLNLDVLNSNFSKRMKL